MSERFENISNLLAELNSVTFSESNKCRLAKGENIDDSDDKNTH